MKRLIIIGGPVGVGKTSVCRQLQEFLPNNVFLDGDWCWDMRPFVVNRETRAMAIGNICDMLNRFIACSAYENIIFCWVLHRPELVKLILSRLNLKDVQVYHYTLMASAPILRGRLMGDVLQGLRSEDTVQRSMVYLRYFRKWETTKIDTDKHKPRQIARNIAKRVQK